jgi:hypothetical protein
MSSVSRIMTLLGFTAQKPVYQAWQQDAVLVRTWEQETVPAIRREAKAAGAMVFAGTTWAPKDETPVVSAPAAASPSI